MVAKAAKPSISSGVDLAYRATDGGWALVQAKTPRKRTRVKIGDMVVYSDKASAAELKRSVAISTDALSRAAKAIAEPGVRLHARRGVPLFSVDPANPDRFIRKLDGKTDRGILENGAFKAVD